MRLRIRRGLDIPIAGAPAQRISRGNEVGWVGVVASDYRGIRPDPVVDVGARVKLGDTLFVDRGRPEIRFTSPGAGEVVTLHRGPRRSLETVVVRLEGEDERAFGEGGAAPADLSREAVREGLLQSGLWTCFRTRPFSQIPDPDSKPFAIFVTAIDTNPLAAEPRVVIDERPQSFSDGVAAIGRLTDGPVYVCQSPGPRLAVPDLDAVKSVTFEGPHPAGLPGTHMHFLDPVSERKVAWHIHYQDVMSVGHLFTTGRLDVDRVVAIGGPVVARPRLLRTRRGASTEDLLRGELEPTECRVLSGSILGGRRAAGYARYLGPYDLQLTALREDKERHFLDWVSPGANKYSAIHAFVSSLRGRGHRFALTTSQHGSPRAMVPIGNFEKVMPLDVLPAPLLKALIVGDADTARALGCLELDEEDLALCSFVCCSKYEYGGFLRETLDAIQGEA